MQTADDYIKAGISFVGRGLKHIETGVYMGIAEGFDCDGDIKLLNLGSISKLFFDRYLVLENGVEKIQV